MISSVLHKINRGIDFIYVLVGSLLFIVMISASSAQVFTRYVLNNSLVGTEELARYCFIWMSLLGGAVAVGRWTHTAITVIYDLLPPVPRKLAFVFQNLCVILLSYIFIRGGITMMQATMLQFTPTLRIPKWIIYLAVPVSGASMGLHAIEWIAGTVGELFRGSGAAEKAAEIAGEGDSE